MGASHSKSQVSKQHQRKSLKSKKNITLKTTTTTTTTVTTPLPAAAAQVPLSRLRHEESSLPPSTTTTEKKTTPTKMEETTVGIDLYTSGATPSILIRDHNANQPLSSLFPNDIPLSETLGSNVTFASSFNSSTVSTLSDLFSTASIVTPNSTLSTTSSKRYDPSFGDGPSFVTRLNEQEGSVLSLQVHVAQSKLIQGSSGSSGSGSDKDKDGDTIHHHTGFHDLLHLAEQQRCVEAYYPLAECYFWGYHHPTSRIPDKTKAYTWFLKASQTFSLPLSTIAWAQYRLALLLAQGDGCELNMEVAVQYLERSADGDNRYAQYMLGLHYQHSLLMGESSPPDIRRALHWYERAARNGCVEAQVALGQLILDHLGVWVDQSGHTQSKWTQLAIHWLEHAAKQKNIKAHVTLGGLYDEGELIPRNPAQAIYHYKAATAIDTSSTTVDTSHNPQVILAHYFVGIHYRFSTPPDLTKAFTHLELASKGHFAPAQRALGLLYLEDVPFRNDTLGHDWLTKAAVQGDIQALGMLGQQAEKQHTETAIFMYQQAAMAGSVAAQLSLANILLRTNRRAEAFDWFKLAATNPSCQDIGHLRQRNLARLMVARYTFNGWHGTDKIDRAWAYQEFIQLADHDQLVDAQFWVGACYNEGILSNNDNKNNNTNNSNGNTTTGSNGIIVARDLTKAFEYYLKSAQGGDLDGQFQVALMLANGSGVAKDSVRAFKWYIKAANRGHPTAQYSLGLFYERGLVEPVDFIKARFWYERASHQQHTTAMIALAQLLLRQHHQEATADHQDALHWLHTAATKDNDKNYTAALRALAGVFEQGNIAVARSDPDRYKKGWLLLQKAADKRDPLAWVDMARYHEFGLGMDKNDDEALACLVQAHVLGYQKARMAIGDLHYRHKRWTKALESYEQVVESNALLKKPGWNARLAVARLKLIEGHDDDSRHPIYDWLSIMVAQPATDDVLMEPLELQGICYEYGKYTNKNLESAIDCYKRVIKIPSTLGMNWIQERTRFRLVEIYMHSDNHSLAWEQLQITKTHFSVMNHQCKSSRTLARTARFYIGYLLLHWHALKPKSDQAQEWLAQASDEGDGNAALELAKLHESKHEFNSAKQRLEQGVSASHSGCMVALALLMDHDNNNNNNSSCISNNSDQMELLERAIELDHTPALYHYGRLVYETYLDDPTHPQPLLNSALDYYMKAAAKGDGQSMRRIGQLYDSLDQYKEAQVWFEQTPTDLFSRAMLIKYHLEGLQEKVSVDGQTNNTFQHLIDITETIWNHHSSETTTTTTSLDRMDRTTLSQLYLYLERTRPDTDSFSFIDPWRLLLRAHDLDPTKETTYALGQLSASQGDFIGALDYFRSGSERWHHAESQYQLGLYHAHGLGDLLEINLVAAQRYLKLAAGQGLDCAKEKLGSVLYRHAWELWHDQKQYERGLKQYERAADVLVPEALVELGHLYHTGFSSSEEDDADNADADADDDDDDDDDDASQGKGFCLITKSYKQAFSYYSQAARQGNAQAALMLGSYYEEGYLDEMENWQEALTWYEKAYRWKCGPLAELAIGKLKHSMADKYLQGNNNNNNNNNEDGYDDYQQQQQQQQIELGLDLQEEAYTWFEGASVACGHAKVMIALYHLKGWGRKPCDPVRGFNLLMQLAPHVESALVEIALCFDQGVGVQSDPSQALIYWEMAAKTGDLMACRRTEEIYRFGLAGICDLQKADEYRHRADLVERTKLNEREKSFCSNSSSSSSSYASRRSSMNSLI